MTDNELFRVRIALIQSFLREHKYDGILLTRTDNFAMATGGRRNYVNRSGDLGAYALFVAKDGKTSFVGNNIEAPRAMDEELAGLDCDAHQFLWFDGSIGETARKHYSGTIVSDDGAYGHIVHAALATLRALLTPIELEKYSRLGILAADAMTATLATIQAGTTETEITATLIAEGARRRCFVPVALVAADDRISKYRHPLPTESRLLTPSIGENAVKRYVMVVGGFLFEGLTVSITRFKQVADLPASITDTYNRICAVDAVIQEACVLGNTLGDAFAACQNAYAQFGFSPTEWHNHHQGGMTGYASRTFKGTPGSTVPILDESWTPRVKEIAGLDIPFGRAFAWNPSAPGVKYEDTFVVTSDGKQQLVTETNMVDTIDLTAVLGRKTHFTRYDIAK